jgi:hypothetical protein
VCECFNKTRKIFLSGELSPTLTHPPEVLDMTLPEQQDLGYLPFRDDFDKVHASIHFDDSKHSLFIDIQTCF